MNRLKKISILSLLMIAALSLTAFAASYSDNWYQDGNGWHIKDGSGATVKNAWVCDDVQDPTRSTWYLIDGNGDMVSNPLVKDGTGNHYSLETAHDGYYGMLRYKNGTYDGMALTFEQSHNGSFGAVKNGLDALKAKYSVKDISNINNSNCVYTSSFGTGKGSSTTVSQTGNTSDRLYWFNIICKCGGCDLNYYDWKSDPQGYYQEFQKQVLANGLKEYITFSDHDTHQKIAAFISSFDWPNMSEMDRLEKVYRRIAIGNNGNTYKAGYSQKTDSWAVFSTGTGTCTNYASELIKLCRLVGLEAKSYDPEYNHVAVKVKIDGQWYAVDPTWHPTLEEMQPCNE